MTIVVTGMGALTGLGVGVGALETGLFCGHSAVRPLAFAEGAFGATVPLSAGSDGKCNLFLRRAIDEAVTQAALHAPVERLAIFIGTTHGNSDLWLDGRTELWWLGRDLDWRALGRQWRISVITTACTASALALGHALDTLRAGLADLAIVAGVEVLTPFLVSGFASLRSLASGNCRPFDCRRDGLALGEGAAALVLESGRHAQARGAIPLAELAGFGTGADATTFTAPDQAASGAVRSLAEAMADAGLGIPPDSINAHGTGTRLNDRMECVAVRRVFGADGGGAAITSTKPFTGHMCGAAGAAEAIAAVLSLQRDEVPPILGFAEPDKDHAGLNFVSGRPQKTTQRTVISLNSAFGGINTALVFRKAA